jgi:hypothetical protein
VFWLGSLIYSARVIWAEGSAFHAIQHASRAWEVLLPYAYAILFFTWSTAMVAVVVGDKLRERLQAALNQAESSDLAKSAFLASSHARIAHTAQRHLRLCAADVP